MRALVIVVTLLSFPAAGQTITCNTVGKTTFCNDGRGNNWTARQHGNNTVIQKSSRPKTTNEWLTDYNKRLERNRSMNCGMIGQPDC